jgi:hypothetical protein
MIQGPLPFNQYDYLGAWVNSHLIRNDDGSEAYTTTVRSGIGVSDFYFKIPNNARIIGIAVILKGRRTSGTTSGILRLRLSKNSGSTYSAYKNTPTLATSSTEYTVGGSTDKWGFTWTPGEINSGSFLVDLEADWKTSLFPTVWCDYFQPIIYYRIQKDIKIIPHKRLKIVRKW